MSNGIIYWNSGTKLLVRLTVSLISLKKVYNGPITVILNEDVPKEYQDILDQHGIDIMRVKYHAGHKQALLAKTQLHRWAPYENNILVDGDTIVLRNFDEMFDWVDEHKFVVTQFADWGTSKHHGPGGRRLGKRIWEWHEIVPREIIDQAANYGHAINIGVYGFQKDATIFEEWPPLAERGIDTFIPDEVSCQLLIPKHKHFLAPQEYNSSCRFSKVTCDTKVIHYHGRKHCSLEKTRAGGGPPTAQIWIDAYKKFYQDDTMSMRSITSKWPDRYTKWIKT